MPSLGTWLRWAHGLRRFAELGLVGLDELTLAGLDERLLPESGGGAVGRMLFGVKEGNGGLGSLLCIGVVPPDHLARSKYGSIRPMRLADGSMTENFSDLRAVLAPSGIRMPTGSFDKDRLY